MDSPNATPERPVRASAAIVAELRESLSPTDGALWTAVLVSSTLDVATTLLGLALGLSEGNLVARQFVDVYGALGIALLKLGALALLASVWWVLDRAPARGGLAGFAVVTVPVSGYNLVLLATL